MKNIGNRTKKSSVFLLGIDKLIPRVHKCSALDADETCRNSVFLGNGICRFADCQVLDDFLVSRTLAMIPILEIKPHLRGAVEVLPPVLHKNPFLWVCLV